MKRISFLTLTVAAGFAFAGCSKDDEPAPKSKSELLQARNWRITADTETVGSETTDVFSSQEACTKDNLVKFMASGILIHDQGKTKCHPLDRQQLTSDWALINSDSKLIIAQLIVFDVTELTENKLVLTSKYTGGGVTTTTRTTYVGE